MAVAELKREANPDTVAMLEHYLDLAKTGKLTDVVLVANVAGDNEYIRSASFQSGWVLLGAIEYAKMCVHKAMDMTAD